MGIRVDPESLRRQLRVRNCAEREKLLFHRTLLGGKLPQTVGGGSVSRASACSICEPPISVRWPAASGRGDGAGLCGEEHLPALRALPLEGEAPAEPPSRNLEIASARLAGRLALQRPERLAGRLASIDRIR